MPLYTYICGQRHESEYLRPMNALTDRCASCGGLATRRPFNRTYITTLDCESYSGGDIARSLVEKQNIRDTAEFRRAESDRAELVNEIRALQTQDI